METGSLTDIERDKHLLRSKMASIKKQYSAEALACKSDVICRQLAATEEFRNARRIALYYSLPDEVQTHSLLEDFYRQKELYLPAVSGSEIVFYRYSGAANLKQGAYGISEPVALQPVALHEIDLFVIPGIAFDHDFHRLGRGKGYYDRILAHVSKPVIGLCFGFQFFDKIPAAAHDIKMTQIISDRYLRMKSGCFDA